VTGRDKFHGAVDLVYAAALDPAQWPAALQGMADTLGDAGAILLYGRDDGAFGVIASPSLHTCVADYGSNGWNQRDIRANRSRERGYFIGRDVITDSDVISADEIQSDPFYAEFLAKHGLRYFAAAMVSPERHVEVALSFQRQIDRPAYNDDELKVVSRFGMHVEKALRLSVRLMNAESINRGLGAALAHLGIGVFALDSLGRAIFSNPAGQNMLGDGLEIVDGRLVLRKSVESERLETAIRKAIDHDVKEETGRPGAILVERRQSNHPLAVYMLPIPVAPAETFLAQARAVVLVINPDAGEPPDPTLVRDLLGLTLSEARMASLVGLGLGPREAAARLAVSEATARTVLKRVFAKTGVSRQSELAALMARLMLR